MEWLDEAFGRINRDGTNGQGAGRGARNRQQGRHGNAPRRQGCHTQFPSSRRSSTASARNGGYGKEDNEITSDLETTYRVMRCFVMMKARPSDVEGVRSFVREMPQ